MQRFEDWPLRLEQYLISCMPERFAYGRMDCCLFVCGAISAMTGVDPGEIFRGTYMTRLEAAGRLRSCCGKASVRLVTEQVAASLGMVEVPVPLGQRGDLLLIRRGRDYSLGLVALDGRKMAVLTQADGVSLRPMVAERAWRV